MADDPRRAGMLAFARSIVGRALPPAMTVSDGARYRAGEFEAAAAVYAALGDEANAANMCAMASTWLKIARDA